MISCVFVSSSKKPAGFEISGHSGSAESGRDIVCAAVSSAAYMAANTVTEILGCEIDALIDDGYMKITLKGRNDAAEDIFAGLKLHLESLAEDYPDFIKISTEV